MSARKKIKSKRKYKQGTKQRVRHMEKARMVADMEVSSDVMLGRAASRYWGKGVAK